MNPNFSDRLLENTDSREHAGSSDESDGFFLLLYFIILFLIE